MSDHVINHSFITPWTDDNDNSLIRSSVTRISYSILKKWNQQWCVLIRTWLIIPTDGKSPSNQRRYIRVIVNGAWRERSIALLFCMLLAVVIFIVALVVVLLIILNGVVLDVPVVVAILLVVIIVVVVVLDDVNESSRETGRVATILPQDPT